MDMSCLFFRRLTMSEVVRTTDASAHNVKRLFLAQACLAQAFLLHAFLAQAVLAQAFLAQAPHIASARSVPSIHTASAVPRRSASSIYTALRSAPSPLPSAFPLPFSLP